MKPAAIFALLLVSSAAPFTSSNNPRFVTYTTAPGAVKLYWKDDQGQPLKSLGNLRAWLARRGQQLVFATNGGMYRPDGAPQGLYIDNQRVITPLDTTSGPGNFYLKPNGVFYITTAGAAGICPTAAFRNPGTIRYATQSGPLLVLNGQLHPAFRVGSANVNVRNGVGLLPDGRVVFVMSKAPVNFYDFATCFQRLGCRQALYLDGLVSRTYLPEKGWVQTDGNFGVLVGVSAPVAPRPPARSPKKGKTSR